jgi:poly(A) polymerase
MSIIGSLPKALISWVESIDPPVQIWLVGGAVRDFFLERTTVDLDFAVAGDGLELARRAADQLDGDVFALDQDRGTARVLLDKNGPARRVFDFATLRGGTIEADLRARDFTVNSIAVDLSTPGVLIDPCRGLQDVRAGIIRVCSPESIKDDPVRALRAVRLASELGFKIEEGTRGLLHEAAGALRSISRERVRDELFRMLAVDDPGVPLYLVRHFGFESEVFGTEISESKLEIVRSVWREFSAVLRALAAEYDPETAADASSGLLVWQLGRFRTDLQAYFRAEISPFRRCRELSFFGSFDWLRPNEESAMPGAGDSLRLSQAEASWVRNFIRGMDLLEDLKPEPLAIYHFFRSASEAGVACGLVHLAHVLAREGSGLRAEVWAEQVGTVRSLLEAYFARRETLIDPAPILSGEELMEELKLPPGPRIGRILEKMREMQVAGIVSNRAQALEQAHLIYSQLMKEEM